MKHFYLNKTGLDTLWSKIMANLGNAANYLKSELTKLSDTLTAAIAKETKNREEADKNLKNELIKDAEDKYLPLKGGGKIVYKDGVSNPHENNLLIRPTVMEFHNDRVDDSGGFTTTSFKQYRPLWSRYTYANNSTETIEILRDSIDMLQVDSKGNIKSRVKIYHGGIETGYFNTSKFSSNGSSIWLTNKQDNSGQTLEMFSNGGIKYTRTDGKSNGQDTELFNRTGSYKTIGVDIAPLKDGTVPLDNLPPLNYVPNNKASQIRTAESIYRITDDGLVLTKNENTSVGSTGNYINFRTPSITGGGAIEILNKQSSDDNVSTAYSKMYSGYIYLNTTTANKQMNAYLNAGSLSVSTTPDPSDSKVEKGIHLLTENNTLIQLNNAGTVGKIYANGVDFDKKGYVVGANKDFYEVGTGANCLLRLDANGEIPTDAAGGYVPLKKASTIVVNNTYSYDIGDSFIVGLNGGNKKLELNNDFVRLQKTNGDTSFQLDNVMSTFNTSVEVRNQGGLSVYSGVSSSNWMQIQANRIYSKIDDDNYMDIRVDGGITVKRSGSILSGNLIGADGKYYQFDAAYGVPQLDSNGKVKMSNLPSDVGNVTDVKVNGSSVLSNKVANIDLSSYATKSNLPTKTSQLTNDSGFLTSHQSLSGYATTSWVSYNFAGASHTHSYLPLSGGTITGSLHVDGNIESSKDIIAYTSSDARLKENIHEEDWLELIRSLGGTFAFKYKRTGKDSIGMIAQNLVNGRFSDLVTTDEKGYYRVNYISPKLVSLALGGVTQVDDKVVGLQHEVFELKQEIAELKAIVESLKH